MATKLKNLRIKKVDFVDEGANPEAHIKLFKSKEGNEPAPIENEGKKRFGIWKSLVTFLAKAAGMEAEEIDYAIEEIQKENAVSFDERYKETKNRKIAEEIWDVCYALQSSLCSILNDDKLDQIGIQSAMLESLEEFHTVVQESISQWADGKEASLVRIQKNEKVSEMELEQMKSARDRLTKVIEKAAAAPKELETSMGHPKGEEEKMGIEIDKSKLTPAELAFLESIEKRYGREEAKNSAAISVEVPAQPQGEESVVKSAVQIPELPIHLTKEEPFMTEDIYKGLHPAVRAELEELKKFRESTEDKELHEIAKKYCIIGKKEEELVPVLKNLKAAGGTAYNDMIAVLDQAVDTVEKSGIFYEIGKVGHGSRESSAWAEAESKAVELMKSRTGLTKAQALDEVLMANPELAEKCEKED